MNPLMNEFHNESSNNLTKISIILSQTPEKMKIFYVSRVKDFMVLRQKMKHKLCLNNFIGRKNHKTGQLQAFLQTKND